MRKHLLFIIIVLIVAFVIAILVKYFDIFDKIWLWLIGLVGIICGFFQNIYSRVLLLFKSPGDLTGCKTGNTGNLICDTTIPQPVRFPDPVLLSSEDDSDIKTITINVFRYLDDGDTTLGLLYVNRKFYCYTLEDTYREVKLKGKTRIPAGTYKVDFIKQLTPLTIKYRQTRSWFDFHLEIKNVPGFTGVYIHNGGTSSDTEGCLLIADGISSNDQQKMLINSRQTFEEFYKLISDKLRNDYSIHIIVHNENWIDQLKN